MNKSVVGMLTELGTLAILALILLKGPPELGMLIAGILGGVITDRVRTRSKEKTGLGSMKPPSDKGGEPPPRVPMHSSTGFTDAPPDKEGPPPGAFQNIANLIGAGLLAIALGMIMATACTPSKDSGVQPPTVKESGFMAEIAGCAALSKSREEYEKCRLDVTTRYGVDGGPR